MIGIYLGENEYYQRAVAAGAGAATPEARDGGHCKRMWPMTQVSG